MNSPVEPTTCSRCGALLTPGALQGLCPRCLLALNLGTQTEMTAESPGPHGAKPEPPPEPPSLEEIARHFPGLEILELLGRGGMGAVYKARQKQLDRIVALKILPPRPGDDSAFADRFTREAKALAKLLHPNIVALFEFGQADGIYYLLMEYVDGVSLGQLLRSSRVAPREALAIVPQICDALQYAHDQGIVHRDIKPENILLDRKGRVKVADFGLAKIVEATPPLTPSLSPSDGERVIPCVGPGEGKTPLLTEAGKIMGTPKYMSPEQIEAPGAVDHRADIYALGVVFYQMLTGELPGRPLEPPSKKVHIDVRLDEVVLRALEWKPELRYQQASILKTQVETIAATPESGGVPPFVASSAAAVPWMYRGVDYRSKATLFGLPLLHVTAGIDPATGKQRVAKGIIAIGGIAKGVVAIGGVAMGGLALGGLAVGVFACGGCALGVLAFGGLAAALVLAVGGGAAAPIAVGGGALGYFACGGSAIGAHVVDAGTRDPAAVRFLLPWATTLVQHVLLISALLFGAILAIGLGVPMWLLQRTGCRGADERRRPGKTDGARRIATIGELAIFALVSMLLVAGWGKPKEMVLGSGLILVFGGLFLGKGVFRGALLVALAAFGLVAAVVMHLDRKAPESAATPWTNSIRLEQKLALGTQGVASCGDDEFRYEVQFDEKSVALTVSYRKQNGVQYRVQIEDNKGRMRALGEGGLVSVSRVEDGRETVQEKKMLSRAEFSRVASFVLQKQAASQSSSRPSFGPVVERILTNDTILGFDSGKVVEQLPEEWQRDGIAESVLTAFAWMEKNQLDAIYLPEGLLGAGMHIHKLSAGDWTSMSAARLEGMTQSLPANPVPAVKMGPDTNGPACYAFHTRAGGVGLLQLTSLADNSQGVKLRYKLVQSSKATVPPASSLAPAAGRAETTFGPVVERVISTTQRETAFLNLTTGEYVNAPKEMTPGEWRGGESLWKQVAEHQIDLMAATDNGHPRIVLCYMGVFDESNKAWDEPARLTPEAVGVLRYPPPEPRPLVMFSPSRWPATLAFHTARGTAGLLQTLGYTDDLRGVKIRYKLVQDSAGSAALKPIPPKAAEAAAAWRAYAEAYLNTHDMKDTNVQLAFGEKASARLKEIEELLKGTIAEPLVEQQHEQIAELVKASRANDTEKAIAASDRLQAVGTQLEKMLGLGDRPSSPQSAPAASLQFRWVAAPGDTNSPADVLPYLRERSKGQELRVLREVVADTDDIESAGFTEYQPGQKELAVFLTPQGGRKLAEATAKNVGRQLAIVWNGRVVSAPVMRTAITGRGVNITGLFNDKEAKELLDLLNHRRPAVNPSPAAQADAATIPVEASESAASKLRQEFLQQLADSIPMKYYGYKVKDLRFSADLQWALVIFTNAAAPPPEQEKIFSARARPRWEFTLGKDAFGRYAGSTQQPFYTPGTANTPMILVVVDPQAQEPVGSAQPGASKLRQEFLQQLPESIPMRQYGYKVKDLRFSADLQQALVLFTNAAGPPPQREIILSESARPQWEFVLASDGFQRYVGSAMQPFYTPGTAQTPLVHIKVTMQTP